VRKPQRRNGRDAKKLRGFDAAVPGNDLPSIINKDRIGVAKACDAIGDLPDLRFGMGARIAGVSRTTSIISMRGVGPLAPSIPLRSLLVL
jgi:hypothetical protein